MVTNAGYPSETHVVVTEDGYILEMHRIPYRDPDNPEPAAKRPVVFIQHGLMCSSADWVLEGPELGLGNFNKTKITKFSRSNVPVCDF